MSGHTILQNMKAKVAITIERSVLEEVDRLVARRQFLNRSQAIESAVIESLAKLKRTRLVTALQAVDPDEEKAIAEEGLGSQTDTWPEY